MKCVCGDWENAHKIKFLQNKKYLGGCLICDCSAFGWKTKLVRAK
jgi:hypothetical protein